MSGKKIAFSYIRMSTKEQLKGDSKRRQLEQSRKYAEKRGYDFKDTVEDIGVSAYRGKNFKDGELGKFIEAAKDREFDPDTVVLLIESFDRFSRDDPFSAVAELVKFIETGVTVETTIDGQQYSRVTMGEQQHLLYTAVGVLFRAHEESATKSKRLKESWENKRNGIGEKKITSRTPAWLNLNKKTGDIELIPEAVTVVQKIFDLAIDENMGANSITRFFNQNLDTYPKFTKSKTRSWQESYIKKILNNKSVCGAFQPHRMVDGKQTKVGAEIPDYFPVVISKERFDLAQSRMQERKVSGSGRKGDKFSNIFTRLVFCQSCGGTVRYVDKGKKPKGDTYLMCSNSFRKNGCDSPAWRYDDFEQEFIKEVVELPLDELLRGGNDPQKRKNLIDDIASLKLSISEEEKDYDENRKLMNSARKEGNQRRQKGFNEDLLENEKRLDELELLLKEKELNLAEMESRLKRRTQDELIEFYDKAKSATDELEKIVLRRKMNSLIRSITSKIVINNNFNNVPVWETLDTDLPKELIAELNRKGYKTQSEIESYFDSPYGRRIFNEALREIKIHFKGGGVRICRPSKSRSYKLQRKVRTFLGNEKKRVAEQELKARRRTYQKESKKQFELGEKLHKMLEEHDELGMEAEAQEFVESWGDREKDALAYYYESIEDKK